MDDKAREAFEARCSSHINCSRKDSGEYVDVFTEGEWQEFKDGWAAALQWAASQQAPKTAEEMRPDFEWWWQTRGIFPPLGTREAAAAWGAWLASGGYKAPSDWKLSPAPWGWDAAVAASQQAAEGEVDGITPWVVAQILGIKGSQVLTTLMRYGAQVTLNQPLSPTLVLCLFREFAAPPATQGGAFLPGEYERMTENGRKAWEGVDPQDLRAGNFPQGGADEQR
jgi:hypothetical protein